MFIYSKFIVAKLINSTSMNKLQTTLVDVNENCIKNQ
jgi:hypothetical protein